MAVDFCTGGTASHPGGYAAAANAFDDDNGTTYAQNYGGESPPWWIKYDLGEGNEERAVKQTMMSSAGYGPSYMPSAWTLYGSNDDSDWDELDVRSGITWAGAAQRQEWEFVNATAYRYYKWVFTTCPDYYLVIGELELIGSDTPPDAAPANYLMSRMRDRFRKKGISLGLPVLADQNRSFLITRHNRFRGVGISMEPSVPTVLLSYFMPAALTANDAPSPWVVSANTEYSADYAAWKAFLFGGGRWSNDGSGSNGACLKVDSGPDTPLLVTNVLIKNYTSQGVNGFKIQGSANGSDWTDLYTNNAADNTNFQAFSFTNATAYRYHRLLFNGAGYGGSWCSLTAFALWSSQPNPQPVIFDEWDPDLDSGSPAEYSNGNLTVSCLAGAWASIPGTMQKNSGKWYFEVACDDAGDFQIGIAMPGPVPTSYTYKGSTGQKVDTAETAESYGNTYDYPAVIGVAVDFDAHKIWFSKNGTWQASGDPAAGTNPAYNNIPEYPGWRPFVKLAFSQVTINAGATALDYDPPEGFNPGWYDEV